MKINYIQIEIKNTKKSKEMTRRQKNGSGQYRKEKKELENKAVKKRNREKEGREQERNKQ